MVMHKFNELFPNGLDPPVNWKSQVQIDVVKKLAKELGISKDRDKTQQLLKNLKIKEEMKRKELKQPDLILENIRLKLGDVILDDDQKVLFNYGRIWDGTIIHFVKLQTT